MGTRQQDDWVLDEVTSEVMEGVLLKRDGSQRRGHVPTHRILTVGALWGSAPLNSLALINTTTNSSISLHAVIPAVETHQQPSEISIR